MLKYRDLIEHQILLKPKMGSSLFWFYNWTVLWALYFNIPPKFPHDEDVNSVGDVVSEGT